jgi:N-acetylglutamate synthase-like GNAT family acetyltransferase
MQVRVLPIDEWERLDGTELETVYPIVPPGMADFVVVEDQGRIVGCWGLLVLPHVDGLWVHPDYRRGAVVQRRLLQGMRAAGQARGFTRAITTALEADVAALIEKWRGERLPGTHYLLPLGAP